MTKTQRNNITLAKSINFYQELIINIKNDFNLYIYTYARPKNN